jgi:hypothetical protein
MEEPESIRVEFFLRDRMLRFRVKLAKIDDIPARVGNGPLRTDGQRQARAEQRSMQRVRALLLVIKAKLESVESEVETFEQAFLSNIVLADNLTVYERINEPIALEYKSGAVAQMMLEGPSRG